MNIRKFISKIVIKLVSKTLINISDYISNIRKNVSIKYTHEKGRKRVNFTFSTNYIIFCFLSDLRPFFEFPLFSFYA